MVLSAAQRAQPGAHGTQYGSPPPSWERAKPLRQAPTTHSFLAVAQPATPNGATHCIGLGSQRLNVGPPEDGCVIAVFCTCLHTRAACQPVARHTAATEVREGSGCTWHTATKRPNKTCTHHWRHLRAAVSLAAQCASYRYLCMHVGGVLQGGAKTRNNMVGRPHAARLTQLHCSDACSAPNVAAGNAALQQQTPCYCWRRQASER